MVVRCWQLTQSEKLETGGIAQRMLFMHGERLSSETYETRKTSAKPVDRPARGGLLVLCLSSLLTYILHTYVR